MELDSTTTADTQSVQVINESTDVTPTIAKVETLADFNLSHAVLLLLKAIGLIPSTSTTASSSALNQHNDSQSGWLPLLPTADAVFLLSTIPAALRPALNVAVPTSPATPATRRQLVETLSRLALEPSLTMEVMMRFRPLTPVLWGRWLEMLGIDGEGAWREGDAREGEQAAVEKVLAAMVRVLPVFENVFP